MRSIPLNSRSKDKFQSVVAVKVSSESVSTMFISETGASADGGFVVLASCDGSEDLSDKIF